ncbi:MAG TPA: sensor histidine kinase [Tepidisphaeraceae bacterium]|jgi:signal transduction histidine kinase|nr:sensor histidine kinase [Tepidisphaeraceae bacterium]
MKSKLWKSNSAADKGGTAAFLQPGRTDADFDAAKFKADPNRLRQVLVNLLDNALKYTCRGGLVQFSAQVQAAGVIIEVKDNGMGISPEELPRIWDRLYRSDKSRTQRGLGLGLSLVKAVVEAHHGTVSVTSRVSGGSIFTVRLPIGNSSQPA